MQTKRSNGQPPAGIYFPEIPVDTEPRLSEAVRLLHSYVEQLQDLQTETRGVQVPTDPEALASLRAALLTQDRVPSVAEITGLLAQPQRARVEILDSLPDVAFAQEGEVVLVNSLLYVFVPGLGGVPGGWQFIAGEGRITQTITASVTIADPNASSTVYPVGVRLRYVLTTDALGPWTVNWNAVFRGVGPLTVDRTNDRVTIVDFDVYATNRFVHIAASGGHDVS